MVVSSWTLLGLESIYWWFLNKIKISCSFSRCFGRTTTDFYELLLLIGAVGFYESFLRKEDLGRMFAASDFYEDNIDDD